MLETLSQYIAEKNWSAVIGMHTGVQIYKNEKDFSVHMNGMELSDITKEEIADTPACWHLIENSEYAMFACCFIIICGVTCYFSFNGTKKEHCPECDREINGRCGHCNNPSN